MEDYRQEIVDHANEVYRELKEKRAQLEKLKREIEWLNNELLETECQTLMEWNYDEEKWEVLE